MIAMMCYALSPHTSLCCDVSLSSLYLHLTRGVKRNGVTDNTGDEYCMK